MSDECCRTGAKGLSARTIATALGQCDCGGGQHPHDPADLTRCRDYCARQGIPTSSLREVMPAVSREWAALIPAWDELLAILAQEEPDQRAPRTYARMRELLGGAR